MKTMKKTQINTEKCSADLPPAAYADKSPRKEGELPARIPAFQKQKSRKPKKAWKGQ